MGHEKLTAKIQIISNEWPFISEEELRRMETSDYRKRGSWSRRESMNWVWCWLESLPQGLVVSVVMLRGDGTFESWCLVEGLVTGAAPQRELLLISSEKVVMELAPRWHRAFSPTVMPFRDAARIPLPGAKSMESLYLGLSAFMNELFFIKQKQKQNNQHLGLC